MSFHLHCNCFAILVEHNRFKSFLIPLLQRLKFLSQSVLDVNLNHIRTLYHYHLQYSHGFITRSCPGNFSDLLPTAHHKTPHWAEADLSLARLYRYYRSCCLCPTLVITTPRTVIPLFIFGSAVNEIEIMSTVNITPGCPIKMLIQSLFLTQSHFSLFFGHLLLEPKLKPHRP